MTRPLDGVTAVTLEHAVVAPFCTRQLADLGARLIKIERPEAQRLGLVNQVHPAASPAQATYACAREMADQVSPRSTRMLERQLRELPLQTLHEAVLTDGEEMLLAIVGEGFQKGNRAFMEKRAPRCTGR